MKLVKTPFFYIPEACKRYPSQAEPPCIGYHREYPRERRHAGAPLRDSNMAAGNQWQHLEFTLALSKRFFSL